MPVSLGPGMLPVNPVAATRGPGMQPNRRLNPGPDTLPVSPGAGRRWVSPVAGMRRVSRVGAGAESTRWRTWRGSTGGVNPGPGQAPQPSTGDPAQPGPGHAGQPSGPPSPGPSGQPGTGHPGGMPSMSIKGILIAAAAIVAVVIAVVAAFFLLRPNSPQQTTAQQSPTPTASPWRWAAPQAPPLRAPLRRPDRCFAEGTCTQSPVGAKP